MFRQGVDLTDTPRLDSQCDRMLARLQKGAATNVELAGISLKYTSRITDLRQLGHTIDCEKQRNGVTVYRLVPKVVQQAQQLSMFGAQR